jgi:hypothetical protein
MQVGDLVKYISPSGRWDDAWKEVGIIVRCIPGTDKRKVVKWCTGTHGCYPARNLEVLNASR